jgi:low temperature requirement protein LtrA
MTSVFNSTPLEYILYTGYVLCFIGCNIIAVLISLFYRKNFQRSSPRWGFLISMILSVLFLATLLAARNGSLLLATAAKIALTGAALTSLYSCLSLYALMRKVRK